MVWRKRSGRPKVIPKCNRCVRGGSCRIVSGQGDWIQWYCAICRNPMTDQELMRPAIALIERQAGDQVMRETDEP